MQNNGQGFFDWSFYNLNAIFGAFATAGFPAFVIDSIAKLIGYNIHPLIPFLIGLFIGSISSILKVCEIRAAPIEPQIP